MRSNFFLLFVLCLVCLFSARAQTVSEAESSIVLNEKTADVSIVLENSSKDFDGRIELEILDGENKIRANTTQDLRIKKGRETYQVSLPLGSLMQMSQDEIAWYRLHYRVGQTEGVVSISEIIKDVFELRMAAAENLLPGTDYRVRVRALHSYTELPIQNVKMDAQIKLTIKNGETEEKTTLAAKWRDGRGRIGVSGF